MITNQKHIIRKTTLNITSASSDGFLLKEQASGWLHNDLLPAIEKEFDNHDHPDTVIQIPKLDITVNTTDINNWRETILPKVLERIRSSVNEKISSAPKITVTDMRYRGENRETAVSAPAHFLSVFRHYLLTGTIPWQSTIQTKQELLLGFLRFLKESTSEQKSDLLTLLHDDQTALLRLFYLLHDSATDIVEIYRQLAFDTSGPLLQTWKECIAIFSTIAKDETEALLVAEKLFTLGLFTKNENKAGQLNRAFEETARQLIVRNIITMQDLRRAPLPQQLEDVVERLFDRSIKDGGKTAIRIKDKPVTGKEAGIKTDSGKTSDTLHNANKSIKKQRDFADEIINETFTDGVYIANAGLVLVAPFLNPVFEKTGLAKNYKITDIDKAVCLAGYIASGNTDVVEFELTLPKILCGVELKQEINTSVRLSKELLDETKAMLQSVVEHWQVLGNTTPEGLRDSFLKREGKLVLKNNEWLLQVEQRSYDMLLQQIPWNYQWIKLPWMPAMLRVEWVS